MSTALTALAVVGLMSCTAKAQPAGAVVTAEATPQYAEVKAGGGGEVAVAVTIKHQPGWHTWPAAEVELPAEIAEFAIRTEITLGDGAPAGVTIAGIQWPEAHPGEVPDISGESPTMTVPLYSDNAVAYVWLALSADVAAGEVNVPIVVSFQSCNAEMCLAPDQAKVDVTMKVGATQGTASASAVFQGLKPRNAGGAEPQSKPRVTGSNGDGVPIAPPPPPKIFGIGLLSPDTVLGLAVLLAVSIIGGAVLNLTPCVLPIIPIKVMTLTSHAGGSQRRAFLLGVWMFLGVAAFWVAAGIPMAATAGQFDLSRYIYGTWWIGLSIGLVISLMGLGIMGLFTFNLPQSVYMVNPKADAPFGSFMFGVMTAILGLPCFAFVAGGLLAGSASLPPAAIMVVFLGLGIGMGAPFLVLSAKPSLLNFLPRTGPASELVKQVMGLLLMAAAAWFIVAGISTLLKEQPYVASAMNLWAVTFFLVIAGVWLTVRTVQISKKTWPKLVMPLFSVLVVLASLFFAIGQTSVAKTDWDIAQAEAKKHRGEEGLVTGAWSEFSEEKLNEALAAGKVVMVDFTADWCITCKFLKRTILDRDPVYSRLRNGDQYVLMEADLTSASAEGWNYMRDKLGRSGVPTLAFYGPGTAEPIVHNAYTPETVMEALDQAAGPAKENERSAWTEFSEPKLNEALSKGKVVVVDFTADWDITIKMLRRTVLDRDPVRSRLFEDGIVTLEADLTSSSAEGWNYLRDKLGRSGVPTLAFYGPGAAEPIVHNAYTPDMVLDALDTVTKK